MSRAVESESSDIQEHVVNAYSPPPQYGGQQPAPAQYGPPYRPPVVSTTHVVLAWVLAVLTGFYMLPWAIAATRQKSSTVTIAWVNLLTGWTIVGWIATLVWACLSDRPPAGATTVGSSGGYMPTTQPMTSASAPAGWYPDGSGQQRYWDGVAWTEHTEQTAPPGATST